MIRECNYTNSLSDIRLTAQAKADILHNIYAQQKKLEEKKVSTTATAEKVKRTSLLKSKKLWIPLTSCLSVAVIIAIILVVSFSGVQAQPKSFVVDNPLARKERIDITTRVENAQYVPDVYQLSGVQSDGSIALASYDNQNIATATDADNISNESVAVSDNVLKLNYEEYKDIVDNIGTIDDKMSAEDIKKEVLFMMKIIPGYDQWFELSEYIPYIEDSSEYLYDKFRLNYDKTTGHITMTRIRYSGSYDIYDSSTRMLYLSSNKKTREIISAREVLKVDFYTDDKGKEIVECVNTKYLRFKDEYFPVYLQVIKNTEGQSASKLSIDFTMSNDLVEKFYTGETNGNYKYYIDEVYDIRDNNKYGTVVKYFEMDYSDENDVSMLKIDKFFPTMYRTNPQTTNLAFYRRSGDSMMYYIDAWHYFDEENSTVNTYLTNEYAIRGKIDYDELYNEEAVKESIVLDAPSYYFGMFNCFECSKNNYPGSDFIKTCPHIKSRQFITRKSSDIIYNEGGIYGDYATAYKETASTLQKMYKNIIGSEKTFDIKGTPDDYGFEEQVDAYTKSLSDSYVDNIFDLDEVINTVSEASKSYQSITENQIQEIANNAILGIKEIESNSYAKKGVFVYDFTVKLTDTKNVESDKDYYLAVYLNSYTENKKKLKTVVFGKQLIDINTEQSYSMQGQIDYMTMVKEVAQRLDESKSFYGDLCIGIVSFDEEGNLVKETVSKLLTAEGDNSLYANEYEDLFYKIRTTFYLRFEIEIYTDLFDWYN